jgi:hypothetical protein
VIPWLHGCDLLEEDADEVLLGLLARDNEPTPHYVSRPPRPPAPRDFDPAEFRRHMQRLIVQRASEERETFARERDRLDRLIASEDEPPPKPKPFPHPKVTEFIAAYKAAHTPSPLPPKPPPVGTWYDPAPHPKQNVEPWFDLSRIPTLGDLRGIAQYALGYFVGSRRPLPPGSLTVGEMITRAVCERDADAIATALQNLEAPRSARLSAALLDVPEGLLAVTLGCPFVALRVASVEEGRQVSIEVTWDHGD